MSEYQYYEFRAVDRPLSAEQLKSLRDLSTRAAITPTSFVNTYNWGDFKGDPSRLIERMFDAFLYVSNWGTRRFQLRLPESLAALRGIEPYCQGPFANVRVHRKDVILEFDAEEIYPEYCDEEEEVMGLLLSLREDILRGDYRCLYLAWLRSMQEEEIEDDEIEPPPPPGLADLSPPLSAFADFFEIDPDLITAAVEGSAAAPAKPSRKELAAWLAAMPAVEKDKLLCAAACGETLTLGAELLRRFQRDKLQAGNDDDPAWSPRTAGELRSVAASRAEERERTKAARREEQKRREEVKHAAERAKYLERLSGRAEETWDRVGELIATRRPKDYDRAVQLLVDLRDLAIRDKCKTDFEFGLKVIREEHANKPSFQDRLTKGGLTDDSASSQL